MNRKLLGGLAAAGLTVATLGALPLSAEAGSAATTTKPAASAAKANDAGRNLIRSKAPQLKVSANETFSLVRGVTSSTNGLQYAAYEREYKGLDVYGGDFVVTTNAKGQILSTSVAQTKKIGNLSTKPTISKAKASAAAKSKLTVIKKAATPELVVYALGAKPRLAWQVAVAGSKGVERHTSVLAVYVDARTGKVIRANEQLHYADGEGTGFYNGPSPLPLDVALSGSTYSLEDASNGFKCQNMSFTTLTSTDNKFGNGDGTSIETGCADAYYAVQTQDDMLTEWLGRDSFNGSGGSWPLRVGLDDVNAFYCTGQFGCPAGGEQVQIGHRSSGNTWISSMDVVAHEMGHGIDAHTGSGGVSGGKTQEFVADVFGTLTEHYDNQGADYDAPDYTIGEEADLVGNGPIRVMYKPDTISGHPNCYSSSLPSSVHAAAGPGNHWFYLLAEGSAPAGKPASPTCNGSTISGIGIEKAGKIFYNGLLQKASNASYPNFRKWTLQAAKNLYPGSCAEFNVVKAAWTAISVPAQTGEATCTTQGNTVTVTNPGNKSGTVGTATSLQLTGSSSGGGALTWTATGLPTGLSINATTGLISGTPTTAGTFNVTATGKDSTNATGSTTFTWTISGGTGGGSELQNGVAKTGLSGATSSTQTFTLQVPAGATGLKFVTSGGTGDADMYVKFGSAPTTSSYDCRPYLNGNSETCNIASAQAGTYYVMIRGYSAYSGLSLTGSYTAGTGGGTVLQNGVPVTGLSAATGASKSYTMVVPAGATGLKFTISGGTGDADLYVKFGSAPTTSSYDCRPYTAGNSETCTISTAQAGTYYVMVRAYSAYSGVTLTGSHS